MKKYIDWISVDDRLPDEEFDKCFKEYGDDYIEVLAAIKDFKSSTVLEYDGNGFFRDGYDYTRLVTHWASMPELP